MDDWELKVRERIRDAIARYSWAGDSGRPVELASVFQPAGVLDLPGRPSIVGRESIADFIREIGSTSPPPPTGWRLVRHLVTNIRFTSVMPEVANVESYFTVITQAGLDHTGRYRDIFEPVGGEWLIRRRQAKVDWWAPESVMASSRPR